MTVPTAPESAQDLCAWGGSVRRIRFVSSCASQSHHEIRLPKFCEMQAGKSLWTTTASAGRCIMLVATIKIAKRAIGKSKRLPD
jgi:hypothetical protein